MQLSSLCLWSHRNAVEASWTFDGALQSITPIVPRGFVQGFHELQKGSLFRWVLKGSHSETLSKAPALVGSGTGQLQLGHFHMVGLAKDLYIFLIYLIASCK